MSTLKRYRSLVYDSARWEGFPFREGDILITTPPKSGTTWMQMICALLVIQDPDRVTCISVARDPRDAAISFANHADNVDMDAFMPIRRPGRSGPTISPTSWGARRDVLARLIDQSPSKRTAGCGRVFTLREKTSGRA